jgi:hypothetical protein
VGLHGLLGDVVLAIEVDVLSETGTAVERSHRHTALQNEPGRTLPHQKGYKLHLGSIAKFGFRTEAQVLGAKDHISTLVSKY